MNGKSLDAVFGPGSVNLDEPSAPSQIVVNWPKSRNESEEHGRKLFVGCIPPSGSVEKLQEIFSPYGEIDEVANIIFKGTHGQGCTFVKYIDVERKVIETVSGRMKIRPIDKDNLVVRPSNPNGLTGQEFKELHAQNGSS